jgi:Ni/Co efflux regulator RcnB
MKVRSMAGKFVRLAMVPLLVASVGIGAAQGQGRGRNNNDRGKDFHFRDQDRGRFQSHYSSDINRWRSHPQGRPHFVRGQRIPNGYAFRPVPRSYYANVPPPPPGYQYGYYDGYVVAYSPTTRVIADVLDLVGAAASR